MVVEGEVRIVTMDNIRNIYCIGRNYRLHAEELGNEVPDEPMVFLKPSHALVPMTGQTIEIPLQAGELHYEAELVIHIGRSYERGMSAQDLIDAIALGIDFTLRDVQSVLKKKGHPWLAAKGFMHSAPITSFHPLSDISALNDGNFKLLINGNMVQKGVISNMIFDVQQLLDHCGNYYGLDQGDIILTGTPEGVGAVADGDHMCLQWNNETWGELTIRYQEN